jgi:hypothetical protein
VVGGLEASGSGSRLEDPVGTLSRAGMHSAKPLDSLTTDHDLDTTLLSEHRVAADLVVERP